ncbi:DUF6884 domain-containing protein [Polyangium jinanense]|uniref:DUF6884 domain-containing protein n=1 Tax=Polyangium jinanense TaxID=2829994 RepID=UPI0035598883
MFTQAKPGASRVALVGCSARKLDHAAPARKFYTSALFRATVAYAEATCNAVRVVSALYGAATRGSSRTTGTFGPSESGTARDGACERSRR